MKSYLKTILLSTILLLIYNKINAVVTFGGAATTSTLPSVSWGTAGGNYRIVVIKPTSSSTSYPTSGYSATYSSSTVYGNGENLGNSNYVVYAGTGTGAINITGLNAGTQYSVMVYECTKTYHSFIGLYFYTYTTPASQSGSKYTLATQPTVQASNLVLTAGANSMTISWTFGSGSYEIVTVRPSGYAEVDPVDGYGYSASSVYGSGSNLGSNNFVVYSSSSNNVTVTNLTPGTRYYVTVYTYSGSGGSANYLTSTSLAGDKYTLSSEPTTVPTSVTATSITGTSFTGSWTSGNGAKRVAIVRPYSGSYYPPLDGTSYTASTIYGNGNNPGSSNYVVYNSTGSSVAVTGLSPATQYFLIVYEYNYNSASVETYNYSPSYGYTLFSTTNNPPTINTVSNTTVCQAAGLQTINLSGIGTGGETQALSITATSSNTSLVPHPTVTYTSPNTTGTLGYTPSTTTSGTALITVTVNDGGPATNTVIKTFSITVSPLPAAAGSVSGSTSVCQGQNGYAYSIPAVAYATDYTWIRPSGATIGTGTNTNSITLNFDGSASSGKVRARGDNACGSGAYSASVYLNVLEKPTTANAGFDQTICTGTGVLSANNPTAGTGVWSKVGGSPGLIVDPNVYNTNVTGLSLGQTAELIWTITNSGICTSKDTVRISYLTCLISSDFYASNTQPCTGSATITFFNTSFGATGCSWNFGSGAIPPTSTSTVSAIVVTYTASGTKDVSLNVTGPGGSSNTNKTSYINVLSAPGVAGSITGTSPVCQSVNGVSYSISTVSNATGYTWTLPTGGIIASGTNTNSILVDFSGSASTGTVSVYGTNVCGNGAASNRAVIVNPLPGSAGTIDGSDTICQGQAGATFTISAVANATGYLWTFGSTTVATTLASLSVDMPDDAVSTSLNVYATNSCGQGSTSPSFSVTVNPLPDQAGLVSGSLEVCQGQTAVSFSVSPVNNATSYNWIKPTGSSISAGNTTNSVEFDFNTSAVSGNVRARGNNACGNGKYSPILNLTVNPLPDAASGISGDVSVCQGESGINYSVSSITNASGYTWSIPSGSSITFGDNTNSVLVSFSNSASSGDVTVMGVNSCGNGTSSAFPVTITPLPGVVATISGSSTVCQGEEAVVYSIPSVTDASSYSWNLFSGANIVSGINTNTITIDFETTVSSDTISVYAVNVCGNGSISPDLAITVNPLPGAAGVIAGTSTVTACDGADGVAYSISAVDNATGYNWTLPTGVAIVSGTNTNSIVTEFASNAASDSITVNATNACGNGISSAELAVVYVPVSPVEICYVTVDSLSESIKIVWQQAETNDIDSFRVYREITTDNYEVIKSVPAAVSSSITDPSANPNTTYYRYKVAAVDTCGNESELSAYHRNMFLQANLGVGGVVNLNWETYEGNTVDYYRVMRDNDSTGVFVKIDSVTGNTNLYTDDDAALYNKARYAIEVVWQSNCAPSFKTTAASINTTRSNIKDKASIAAPSSIIEGEDFAKLVNIYPNPNSGNFNIEYPGGSADYTILLYNMQGSLVYSQVIKGRHSIGKNTSQITVDNLSKGFYTLKIATGGSAARKKLIVE